MIERFQGPEPDKDGWWYGRWRGPRTKPDAIYPQQILKGRVVSYSGQHDVEHFDWFGPVDKCKELKK